MLGRNHALLAACGFLAAAPLTGLSGRELAAGTLLCAGAGLAPDLDHPGSSLSRSLGPASRVASVGVNAISGGHRQGTHSILGSAVAGLLAWALVFYFTSPVPAAVLAGALVAVAGPLLGKATGVKIGAGIGLMVGVGLGWVIWSEIVPLGWWYVWAVAGGWTLHWLPGDLPTPQGVPALWPLSRRRFAVPLFTTGSPIESVVGVGMTVGLGWLIVTA